MDEKKTKTVLAGLEACGGITTQCEKCPYKGTIGLCTCNLTEDAIKLIRELAELIRATAGASPRPTM